MGGSPVLAGGRNGLLKSRVWRCGPPLVDSWECFFAHRFAAHFDALGVVYEAVENGVGEGRVFELTMP